MSGNLSNDLSSISTTSSSLLSEAERRLETPYINGAYHVVPFTMVHSEGEEEVDDAATISGSPQASGASQQRRRILTKEVNEEEEEK